MITFLCNISDNKLRITLLCSEIIWKYKYICIVKKQNGDVDYPLFIN